MAALVIAFMFFRLSDDRSQPLPSIADTDAPATVTATRVGGDDHRTRFVADLTAARGFSVYVISDPFRVVIDLSRVEFDLTPGIGLRGRGLIKSYRYGEFAPDKSRIVLDADAPVLIEKAYVAEAHDGQPARLVVDLVRTDQATFDRILQHVSKTIRADDKARDTGSQASDIRRSTVTGRLDTVPAPPRKPERRAQSNPSPARTTERENKPARADAREPTVAAAAGADNSAFDKAYAALKRVMSALSDPPPLPPAKPRNVRPDKPVIVLDPGHGGIDPGATSASGRKEKNLVLAFARMLRAKLMATKRYSVLMTRDNDNFVTLGNRVRFARRNHADLFMSIHADSLKSGNARGATVYTVSKRASDRTAAEIAAGENRVDALAGIDMKAESDDVAGILIDLIQHETQGASLYFAKTLVARMGKVTRMNDRPHRSAGFRVLRAPDVPSVLVELGYLSSRSDAKLMFQRNWRANVVAAMVHAINAFFDAKSNFGG